MVVNANDRIIRLYEIPSDVRQPPILKHKLQDLVNRLQYTKFQFSVYGDYLIGGSNMNHNIYIWDTALGSLVKILDGPAEALEDLTVCFVE